MDNLPGRSFAYKCDTDTSNIGPPPNLGPMEGAPPMGPLSRGYSNSVHFVLVVTIYNTINSNSIIAGLAILPQPLEHIVTIIVINLTAPRVWHQWCSLTFTAYVRAMAVVLCVSVCVCVCLLRQLLHTWFIQCKQVAIRLFVAFLRCEDFVENASFKSSDDIY